MNSNKISNLPLEAIVPYANNARVHSPSQIQQITQSIREFGFINPIVLAEDNTVVAGHGRLLAARELGLEKIPTIRADHLTPDQVRAYRLADNRIADNANWDDGLLRVELEYLISAEVDFDVDLTGFNTPEIDLLLHSDPVPDAEEEPVPPPDPANAISELGDVWCLGQHRVVVADIHDIKAVDTLMGDEKAQMVLTDPPYNVAIRGHVSGLGRVQHREFPMASGEMSSEEFERFLYYAFEQFARVCKDGALLYVFMDFRHMREIVLAGAAFYGPPLNLCTWVKSNAGMGSLYRSQHELVFVFKNGQLPHINNVELGKHGRYRTNVWHYAGMNSFGADRDENLSLHPTVKPVQMLADAILDVTHTGDIVLDGFLGSGSTLIAAERTGRVCYGVELDPGYVDVTVARWEAVTGERATLSGTSLTIDQVAAERGIQREAAA